MTKLNSSITLLGESIEVSEYRMRCVSDAKEGEKDGGGCLGGVGRWRCRMCCVGREPLSSQDTIVLYVNLVANRTAEGRNGVPPPRARGLGPQ